MAIPVYLQQFKAAGIYRVVFDKSTMVNVNTEILRLVVGYSEQGPFNIPTYVTNATQFKTLYGDASKKLEKRGVWFHRLAQQALASGPILALNVKKFTDETVDAATIDTDFNTKFDAIDAEKLYVEDIYNTSRFWELEAAKLNDLRTADGSKMDKYINIATTDTAQSSATYFIRKASGSTVSAYKITLNDWYSDESDPMPEYLENYKSTLVSDYMAEVYVFKGEFTKEQVLASSTLKKHFEVNKEGQLQLRPYELDAFDEPIDTLEALYNDSTSGAIGHYVGSLIPYMKNKYGQYISLDIAFNEDQHIHKMMMSFNTDLLEEDIPVNINISGKDKVTAANLVDICEGDAHVSVLGNRNAEVVASTIKYTNNVSETLEKQYTFEAKDTSIVGTMYVTKIDNDAKQIVLKNTVGENTVTIQADTAAEYSMIKKHFLKTLGYTEAAAGEEFTFEDDDKKDPSVFAGKNVITSIKRIKKNGNVYVINGSDIKISSADMFVVLVAEQTSGHGDHHHIHGSSLSFIKLIEDNWTALDDLTYICTNGDTSLTSVLAEGDSVFGVDADADGYLNQVFVTSIESYNAEDGLYYICGDKVIDVVEYKGLKTRKEAIAETLAEMIANDPDGVYDESMVVLSDEEDYADDFVATQATVIKFTGEPLLHYDSENDPSHNGEDGENDDVYFVRIDGDICQEIGTIIPQYLVGYTYKTDRPENTGMMAKLNWQNFLMSALTDYKGLRTGLLNKSDIDYRYIVDTFETYVTTGAKKVLSFLAKEKQSAFAILNFPAVKTFVKCPYSSYVNDKGVFDVKYVVAGYNKKKAHSLGFSLPSDDEGASFCAFYTPLKFSDGYVDSIVPSAGLVSNLFMQKYMSRQPYYIIAGPNYGAISASGLVGPDYNYSQEELFVIEPYGVNCMVYRPNFGTFINANQTAKQTPLSALSRVNVRELVIYLQDEIEKVLQAYQWEFNNATTRAAILAKANSICANIQANGGIQAYKNIMDESNNTPDIIDNEMAIISTHIEPGFGCGKMVQELTIYKTGGLSASISD